jgi:subtilase family serine protease
VFSSTFGLPSCTSANGCFKKIYATANPRTDAGWALEIALDVEWAHAIAPRARILLVEAKSSSFTDLLKAVDVAVKNGASVVSMSFGGNEFSSQTTYDAHFKVPGVTFVASSGDSGDGVEYPAGSQYVVSVGGTTLTVDSASNYVGETAWSGSGGGASSFEPEPYGQAHFPVPVAGRRGVPDVAYDANPSSGFAVYSSVSYQSQSGWFQVGGTSAGAPQWAALFAIVNSLRASAGRTPLNATYDLLYAAGISGNYHDVTTGSNGTCGTLCTANGSYDYVTGLGTPQQTAVNGGIITTLSAP